jgi:hypothetical protein
MNFMPTRTPVTPAPHRVDLASAPGALIVGGAHVSIGVARSLGRQGVSVWLLANHPLPTYSRYVERSFPWPGADHADGLSSIIDLAKQHNLHGWVLIATGDEDMRRRSAPRRAGKAPATARGRPPYRPWLASPSSCRNGFPAQAKRNIPTPARGSGASRSFP